MLNSIVDLIQTCSDIEGIDELLEKAQLIANYLEFEHVAFGVRTSMVGDNSPVILLNTYPIDWLDSYRQSNLVESDPVVKRALTTAYPFLWSDLKTSAPDFWGAASDFDLNVGWSNPTQHAINSTSLISFVRHSTELNDKELTCKLPHLLYASSVIEERFFQLTGSKKSSETSISLTSREREVLIWSSIGKTVHEISIILGLTERTINFHISNSIRKLNASNKTSAVVKAMTNKLI